MADAGIGHLSMLVSGKSIQSELHRDDLTPEQRRKLRVVEDVRKFAKDDLALNVGDSYANIVWLDRSAVSWIVTASHKTKLEAKTWWFPVAGTFPYLGFYHEKDAQSLEKELEEDGWDSSTSPVAGYSTLGWFSDPLYSPQLIYADYNLVRLIIHETTHNTVWIRGDADFNESLASFVEKEGARLYFISRYGKDSREFSELNMGIKREQERVSIHRKYREKLELLYGNPTLSEQEKLKHRVAIFERYRDALLHQSGNSQSRIKQIKLSKINNTDFLSVDRYESGEAFFAAERKKAASWVDFYKRMDRLSSLDNAGRKILLRSKT